MYIKSDAVYSKYMILMQCPQNSTKHEVPSIAPRKYITSKKTNMAKLTTNKFGLAPYNNYIPVVMASKITTIKH